MKLSDTLKFFSIVLAILAALCLIFPSDGIRIGGTTLRFAKMHDVLVREKQKSIDELLVHEETRDLTGIMDSLSECRHYLFESQTRFWLPNDDVSLLDSFFSKASRAESMNRVVRVLHYGDSQIELDRISCQLRERLQELFGGSGPGLLPLRQPIPTYTFSQHASGNLIGQSTWGDSTFVRAKGNYGPMLRSWRINGNATMNLSATKNKNAPARVGQFSSIRLLFNNRPGPLSVTMRDRKGGATFAATNNDEGVAIIEWSLDSVTSSATLTLNGNTDIYGVLVDGNYGVAVDNISMRGASGTRFTSVNAEQLKEAYRLMDVGLIIMQFGGNSVPYLKGEKSINSYCESLGKQIDFLHQTAPGVPILFIGPSDMSTRVNGRMATYPCLPEVVQKLRDMANSHGAAFWSIYDAMGGENSMLSWNSNGLAGADYVHFTPKGAAIMGDYISDALTRLYELYLLRQKVGEKQFNELWNSTSSITTR